MGLMTGKKGVIFGVSNTHGIAYGIAKQLFEAGAEIARLLSDVPKGTTEGLMVCMAIIPILFLLGAFVLYMKKYKIDEPEYERICAEIRKRDGIEDETPCDGECTCDCCDGEECDCGCHEGEECNCGCEEHTHDSDEKCTCGCCPEHTPDAETPATEDAE